MFCLHEEGAYDDADVVEAHKIDSFVAMLSALDGGTAAARVPVALPVSDAAEVERWPVVQAYALDEVSGKGFFTMHHTVVCAAEAVEASALHALDGAALRGLHAFGLRRFAQQFAVIAGVMDRATDGDGRRRLTERQLAEPLVTYFRHPLLRTAADEAAVDAAVAVRGPRVLFGARTAAAAADELGADADAAQRVRPGAISLNKASETSATGDPTHLTLQCADATGPLACERTWFVRTAGPARVWPQRTVGKGEVLEPLVDEAAAPDVAKPGASDACVRALMRVYAAMADAMADAVDELARALDVSGAGADDGAPADAARAIGAAAAAAVSAMHARGLEEDAAAMRFRCEAVDLDGRVLPPETVGAAPTRCIYRLSMRLDAVPSAQRALAGARAAGCADADTSLPLGGLVLGDSFVLARTPPPLVGGAHASDAAVADAVGTLRPLALTASAVPRLIAWLADGAEARAAERVRLPMSQPKPLTGESDVQRLRAGEHYLLRALLVPAAEATLVPPARAHALLPRLGGSLYCFEEGLAFDSERLGPVVLPFHLGVESLELYDDHAAGTPGAVAEGDGSLRAALARPGALLGGAATRGAGPGATEEAESDDPAHAAGGEGVEGAQAGAALLVLTLRESALPHVYPALRAVLGEGGAPGAESLQLTIALARGSALRRALWRDCLPLWRESLARGGASVRVLDTPPAWLCTPVWPRGGGAPSPRLDLADDSGRGGHPPPLPARAARALELEAQCGPLAPSAGAAPADGAVAVQIVSGHVGSGSAQLAAALRYLSQGEGAWVVLGAGGASAGSGAARPGTRAPSTPRDSAAAAAAAASGECAWEASALKWQPRKLQRDLREALHRVRPGGGASPLRLMLLAPPGVDTLAVVRAVAGIEPAVLARGADGQGWPFRVGGVICCVDAREGADGAARLAPLVAEQCALATHIVLTGCGADVAAYSGGEVADRIAAASAAALGTQPAPRAAWRPREGAAALAARLRALNPAAEILAVEGQRLRRSEEVSAVLEPRAGVVCPFAAPACVAQRARALPAWDAPALPPSLPLAGGTPPSTTLLLVTLAAPCALHEPTLLEELGARRHCVRVTRAHATRHAPRATL